MVRIAAMEVIHPLKHFRDEQNPPLSQGELAGLLGVSRVTVTRWESGAREARASEIPQISEKTGIPVGILVAGFSAARAARRIRRQRQGRSAA